MKRKREVYALDYAIVECVSALERLFRSSVHPLILSIAGGLNIEAETVNEPSPEIRVWIRPVSWPTGNRIYARFCRTGEGLWAAFEGALIARHLPHEMSEFTFECSRRLDGEYDFRGRGTADKALLKLLLAR